MAKYFLIGEIGDGGVWLVDVQDRSVQRIEEEDLARGDRAEGDSFAAFNRARMDNKSLFQGVNLVVASQSRSGPSSHNRIEADH